jgi:hypothetical protein
LKKKIFKVNFNHIISPCVFFELEEDSNVKIKGTVSVDIDNLLSNFTASLGLKNLFSRVVEKKVTSEGYFIDIKGIANASLFIKDDNLIIKAEYSPAKEWWAKPVALTVLSRFLDDFKYKLVSAGVTPGFGESIKKALQSLKKINSAELELKKLFDKQNFYLEDKLFFIENFEFTTLEAFSENESFVISFEGVSKVRVR